MQIVLTQMLQTLTAIRGYDRANIQHLRSVYNAVIGESYAGDSVDLKMAEGDRASGVGQVWDAGAGAAGSWMRARMCGILSGNTATLPS